MERQKNTKIIFIRILIERIQKTSENEYRSKADIKTVQGNKKKKNIYIYTENNKSVHQSIINIEIVQVKVKILIQLSFLSHI